MLDTKDFNFFESQSTFDFKGFALKLLGYWKWFVISLVITFLVAYNINIRKEKIFGLDASIVVKDENNSFFTSNTSLVFNWGGVSDKVQTVITTLKSRSHNEQVVGKLEYYINYFKQGKYYLKDVYGETPFYINLDKNKGQVLMLPLTIKFVSPTEFELFADFKERPNVQLCHYIDDTRSNYKTYEKQFKAKFKINQQINLPFANFSLHINPDADNYVGSEYLIRFDDFNETVA